MSDTGIDKQLLRLWDLQIGEETDAVRDEIESLLPSIIAAGYAESDGYKWRLTEAGLAQSELLDKCRDSGNYDGLGTT